MYTLDWKKIFRPTINKQQNHYHCILPDSHYILSLPKVLARPTYFWTSSCSCWILWADNLTTSRDQSKYTTLLEFYVSLAMGNFFLIKPPDVVTLIAELDQEQTKSLYLTILTSTAKTSNGRCMIMTTITCLSAIMVLKFI